MTRTIWPQLKNVHKEIKHRLQELGGIDFFFPEPDDPLKIADWRVYLEAMLDCYEATNNLAWLWRAKRYIDLILPLRADRQNIIDPVVGEKAPCYAFPFKGQSRYHIVFNGQILAEIMRWCNLASPQGVFLTKNIIEYSTDVKQTTDWYLRYLRQANPYGITYTYEEGIGKQLPGHPGPDKFLPFNGALAIGIPMVMMLDIHPAVSDLARYFNAWLRVQHDMFFFPYWQYDYDEGHTLDGEDMSHLPTDLNFVAACKEAGILFTQSHIKLFTESLLCPIQTNWTFENIDKTGERWKIAPRQKGAMVLRATRFAQHSPTIGKMMHEKLHMVVNGASNMYEFVYTAMVGRACVMAKTAKLENYL